MRMTLRLSGLEVVICTCFQRAAANVSYTANNGAELSIARRFPHRSIQITTFTTPEADQAHSLFANALQTVQNENEKDGKALSTCYLGARESIFNIWVFFCVSQGLASLRRGRRCRNRLPTDPQVIAHVFPLARLRSLRPGARTP